MSALHALGVAENVEASCRSAAALSMCTSDQVEAANPLTWCEMCALGSCSACPALAVDVNIGVDTSKSFTFQEWKTGGANKPGRDGKERIVYSLLNTELSIADGIALLQERTLSLCHPQFIFWANASRGARLFPACPITALVRKSSFSNLLF